MRKPARLAAALSLPVLQLAASFAAAEVRLPALVGSHMVLQRDVPARVWGWAAPGETVTIAGGSNTIALGAMIAPVTPLAIRGAVWYQGESNANGAFQYRTLLPAMIRDWRRAWGRGDFPFLFVQLANLMARAKEPGESAWAELREAQAMTLAVPSTGMAVAIDIGESDDIHPKNKKDVGERLARWALADTYGKAVEKSGPLYASAAADGAAMRVRFTHAAGLSTSDGQPPRAFAVAGADRQWRWAQARIDGETVVVSSPDVPQPVGVRYAWGDNPDATLRNGDGLPASPFRTDDWPMLTDHRGEAK